MWFINFGLLLCLFSLCNGYNYTNNFENIAVSDKFIHSVHNYLGDNQSKISEQCKLDMKQYTDALITLKPWAWLMFDAGSKISSGILSGNLVDLGQFDQCMNIENQITSKSVISGKYCLLSIPLTLPETLKSINSVEIKPFHAPETRIMNPDKILSSMFATCLPNSCSSSDVQRLYSWIIKTEVFDLLCQSKSTQPKLTAGDIATISFLSIVFCVMLTSTIYDVFLFYFKKESLHPLLIAFSVLSNGKKLIATTKSTAQVSCLSGIRVISMMWVILGHRFSVASSLPIRNYLDIIQFMNDKKNMYIMGATVSVDTFFVLGGLLVSYSFMVGMAKGANFNIIKFYIHRYLRLTPILAVLILIYVTILKHLGSGPLWYSTMALTTTGCQDYWWSTLLYVQNYVNPENMCIAQSWYLSVDTQLFLLSPIILLPLKRWPKFGLSATALLLFASTLASFLTAWFEELYGYIIANQNEKILHYLNHYYFPTHTRAGPWLIGIILGYCIYEIKQNHRKVPMNKILALMCWVISLIILYACVYTGYNTAKPEYVYDRVANSFYIALLRPGWGLALSWVIIACVTGYGGPVNWFLSLSMFQVVARLTYSMYLVHIAMQTLVSCRIRTSSIFTTLDTLYIFWGDFAFTFAASILFSLAFESPIIVIEKVIFGSGKDKSQRTPPALENEKRNDVP